MRVVQDQPALSDLHSFIDLVPRFPVSVRQLLEYGRNLPQSILNFYRAFPDDEVFENKRDLLTRTEIVEMLQHENPPAEIMTASEED